MLLLQVLGLSLEYGGASLRMEPKRKYLARKMAERKRKKETGELPADAVSVLLMRSTVMAWNYRKS
jgi:hypothetical protein